MRHACAGQGCYRPGDLGLRPQGTGRRAFPLRSAARADVATGDPTMAANSSMAGRYASALFEVARSANALAQVERELERFSDMLRESEDLQRLVKSPVLAATDQIKGLGALLTRAGIGGLSYNFLSLLARNRRLFAVAEVIAHFRALCAAERGEISADVTTAHALAADQMRLLRETLRAAFDKEVLVKTRVDQNLLGGMVVKVGSKMIDSSLRTKLNNLKVAMKGIG
jgi:F-type H+-transporting ATPase subunit delta